MSNEQTTEQTSAGGGEINVNIREEAIGRDQKFYNSTEVRVLKTLI